MISRDQLGEYVEDFLEYFDDLEEDDEIDLGEERESRIKVEERPSNLDTTTLTYSIIGKEGIPLEVKINEDLGYSKIFFKCSQDLDGYSNFAEDNFGNYPQEKEIDSVDRDLIESELENLLAEE